MSTNLVVILLLAALFIGGYFSNKAEENRLKKEPKKKLTVDEKQKPVMEGIAEEPQKIIVVETPESPSRYMPKKNDACCVAFGTKKVVENEDDAEEIILETKPKRQYNRKPKKS